MRKVLIHELVHNVISPHNAQFNTLNSELNKEVVEFEIKAGSDSNDNGDVWNPVGLDAGEIRTSHRLDEPEIISRVSLMNSKEDEIEAMRERVRIAAEARLKESK